MAETRCPDPCLAQDYQSEGGYPNGLCFPCANVWGAEPRPKIVVVVVVVSSSLSRHRCLGIVVSSSLLSRCRRTPPRSMCRKILRARPPLSYHCTENHYRQGKIFRNKFQITVAVYRCFRINFGLQLQYTGISELISDYSYSVPVFSN